MRIKRSIDQKYFSETIIHKIKVENLMLISCTARMRVETNIVHCVISICLFDMRASTCFGIRVPPSGSLELRKLREDGTRMPKHVGARISNKQIDRTPCTVLVFMRNLVSQLYSVNSHTV